MVFDVPAESGGALSVLNDFYGEYKFDQKNEYIFVVSRPELKETNNIKVFRFPWVKKSWIHRLYFDHFIAPKLIKKYKVDEVLSLQNIIIPHTKVYQRVFIHNALPFSEYRFSFREDKLLWIYQNIIGKKIIKSIKKADFVIVQTNWMKRILFKNHKVIIDACIKLKKAGIDNYKVIFTLNGNENKYTSELSKLIKYENLPIELIGGLNREEVFKLYRESILIFPSYIETVGFPLIEAKMHDTPIIVSDYLYAHQALEDYEKATYFNAFDSEALMLKMIENLDLI
jgi:glycosyltransferase involved in cell wall biosynthesis